ncbi:hypothetical protein [Mycolicibacterium parafortuitum]|uniref:hypothetical protein n=1 Tax=Mycolicibacterium parafortuitum TaxID=39692 RepID=UPI0009F56CDE|nr:hypothetical protein [Mycolicibacterium parafortuitum]ORB31271.1 hypothetical protein BST38_07085 [Mycolicibacterium parafortuitum]
MTVDTVVRRLLAAKATTVLIDGRSGSGKSTLADQLQRCWPESVVVRLDDIYPGWDGLAWASEHIGAELLRPRTAGRPGRWRQWDWGTGAPHGWHTVEAGRRLIVEGVGALSAQNRAMADLGIWVETPADIRKHRALQRDGDTYRPHWDRWAAQELVFIDRCDPVTSADYVVTEAGDALVWAPAMR